MKSNIRKAVKSLFLISLSAWVPMSGIVFDASSLAQEPAAKTDEVKPAENKEEAAGEAASVAGNITVNFKGAEIKTVLAYISEVSGVDIVPAPDVKGIVDLKLTNKPWKSALDIILRNYGFAYEREGDIIRVVTVDKLKMEELTTQAFNLNYSKAKDVVTAIKDIVGERGKVMYDERTNTVLVTDIPTNIYKIGQIIGRLDKRTDQVLIEALIIETLLDDTEKLGIDWNLKFSVSGAKRPTTIPFEQWLVPFGGKKGDTQSYFPQIQTGASSSVAQTAGGATTTTTSNTATFPATPEGFFNFPYAMSTDFAFGSLDFSEFKAIVEMLKSRSDTDLISNPRIATLNNNEASINVGQILNLPKFERNPQSYKMEITGYTPQPLGITLKVTPHVNDAQEIVIDLEPAIIDLLRYDTLDKATGIVAPVFSSRQAKTQVRIKDGQTVFIAGLIKESMIDTRRKIPILGDLLGDVPGIGMLVSKKETVKQKTELVFFITVNIMSPDKVIKDVPQSSKAYVPMFTATQEGDKVAKKRLRKK